MTPGEVTPCLVTRGNVDMTAILASVSHARFAPPVVWDNSVRDDCKVYGRYLAAAEASTDVVYVQDDDCVLPTDSLRALVAAYEPGRIIANMPQAHRHKYTDSCLIGFGAIFDKDLPARAFERFGAHGRYRPDVIFTTLTPFTLVDVPVEILPCAYEDYRMYKQRDHDHQRRRTLIRARQVRDS